MIDTRGRQRIANFVTALIDLRGTTAVAVGKQPGRPSLPTIKRIKTADPDVSDGMLLALGAKLGLPANYLVYVGTGDTRRISSSGADQDLIRFTLELISEDRPRDQTEHVQ